MKKIVFIILLMIVVGGCDAFEDKNTAAKVYKLQEEVFQLQRDTAALRKSLDSAERMNASLAGRISLLSGYFAEDAEISTVDEGYASLMTKAGMFVISFVDLKRHANGSRLILKIGNLTTADVVDSFLSIKYRPKNNPPSSAAAVLTATRNIREKIIRGAWTTVYIDIKDLTPERLDSRFRIKFMPNALELAASPRH